jgi:hypothetical protein
MRGVGGGVVTSGDTMVSHTRDNGDLVMMVEEW